jgi:hypothetical protein
MKKNSIKSVFLALSGLLLFAAGFSANEQEDRYQHLEDLKDENMVYYTRIYQIVEHYPDFKYNSVYDDDGELKNVIVEGVDNDIDRKRLAVLIYDYKKGQEQMIDIPARAGIYYATRVEAEPKMGWRSFFQELHTNIEYPEDAKEWGAEGNLIIEFVIDEEGEIDRLKATEVDITAVMDTHVEELKEVAKQAILETSGQWEPARVNGEPVASRAVIPVTFRVEPFPSFPHFGTVD